MPKRIDGIKNRVMHVYLSRQIVVLHERESYSRQPWLFEQSENSHSEGCHRLLKDRWVIEETWQHHVPPKSNRCQIFLNTREVTEDDQHQIKL